MEHNKQEVYSREARNALVLYALGTVFVIFLVYQFGGMVLRDVGTRIVFPYAEAVAQGLAQILFMLLPVMFMARFSPAGSREIFRLDGQVSAFQWLLGIGGILAIKIFAAGWIPIQEMLIPAAAQQSIDMLYEMIEEAYRQMLAGSGPWDGLRALLVGAVIPAFAEEFLFRGYLQRSLEEVLKPRTAIVVSAVMFGSIHVNPVTLVPLILIGAFLGFLAWYTQSLGLPIFLHFFNNAASIVLLYYTGTDQSAGEAESALPGLEELLLLAISGLFALLLITLIIRHFTPGRRPDRPETAGPEPDIL